MNKIAIVTDSTAYLPPELIAEYDIKVIPLAVFHSKVPEQAQALLKDAANALSLDENLMAELSPVIYTHVGPGTLEIAFRRGL